MDGFSFHPYPLNSSVPVDALPSDPDHLGLIDQDVLVRLLGKAFDGTAQVGTGMPILYDEFGIESAIPAEKRELYGGVEPATTRPVAESTQAAAYRRAIQLAYCQSNVAGMLLFHTHDEPGRPGWQSGLVYADGSPKTSLEPVRRAIESAGTERTRCVPGRGEGVGRVHHRRAYDLAPMRARVHLPSPPAAPAAPDGGGDDDRPRRRGAAPPGAGRTGREHPRLVPARRLVPRRGAAGTTRRARQHAVRGACLLAAALLAGCGGDDGSGSPLLVGAVDDRVRHDGPALRQLQDAGFGAVGITSFWHPGSNAPSEEEVAALRSVVEGAGDTRIFLSIYHTGARTTPLTPADRADFAAYVTAVMRAAPEIRDVIIGNEPNLNRFWMPQFDASGGDVAAPAYLALLFEVYDAVQQADPDADRLGRRTGTAGDRPAGNRP